MFLIGREGGGHQKKIVLLGGGGGACGKKLHARGGSYSFVVAINQIPPAPPVLVKNERSLKSPAEINYRRLTEINSRYGLSLFRALTCGPEGVRNKGS